MESLHERGRVAADGFEMAYQAAGSGQPVVCLHSGGLSARQWGRLRDRLAPRRRVLLADFIGYGQSTPWPEDQVFDIRHDIRLVQTLLASLPQPAHVVGHSYGAFLGMKAALERPRLVRSFVLFEPIAFGVLHDGRHGDLVASLPWQADRPALLAAQQREPWLEEFVDWWMGNGAWRRLGDDARTQFRTVAYKLYGEVRSQALDRTPASAYARLPHPALVLSAEQSPPAARRVAEIVADAMPNATLELLKGVGHMAPVRDHADVNARIETFLDAQA